MCGPGDTFINQNPLVPIATVFMYMLSNKDLQLMQVPPSNWQQNIPSLEEFIIKIMLFPMYEDSTLNLNDLPTKIIKFLYVCSHYAFTEHFSAHYSSTKKFWLVI